MRPVNLIPPEERRGARQVARTGPLSYLLVGVLVAALVGVTALVLTDRSISDRKAEVAGLEQQEAALAEQAAKLEPFTAFRTMEESRTATVTALAKSRFDWERVLRELSLVLPEDVWLINLTGTVTPEVTVQDGAEITARDDVPGPALEIIGCAASQDSVGRFVAALHDIDGVTRVTATKSERPELSSADAVGTGSTGGESDDDCRTRDSIARFEVVAAFDEVPLDPSTLAPAGPPAAPTPTSGDDGGVPEAQQQQAQSRGQIDSTVQEGAEAADAVPGS
jgi:Tfp pilus assembly protein PilN